MTLLRQLMLVVLCIYLLLFSANFILTVLDSRQYLEQQLHAHAQDTATSLGVSMATALAESDTANLELLASAVFDRGFYSEISLVDLDNQTRVQKINPARVDGVPAWFINLIKLPSPSAQTEITSGWNQLGTLTVVSNPAHAYRDLWRISNDFFYLFCFILIFSYALIGLVLKRVLRPLLNVEQQANQICERQFVVVDDIPRTRELKRVVEAMNRMSIKVRDMFRRQLQLTESLLEEARTDHLTGLTNRKEFNAQIRALLSTDRGPGACALMLVQIKNFAMINNAIGRDAGDAFLRQVAGRLQGAVRTRQGAIVARYNGADFAIFLPETTPEHARLVLQASFQAVASLALLTTDNQKDALHIGMAFDNQPESVSSLLTEADTALRNAQSSGRSDTHFLIHGDTANPLTDIIKQAREWQATLEQTISNKKILFHYQPVFSLRGQTCFAQELFVRIELEGRVISAGVFMPMAERFDLLSSLDQLIVSTAFEQISKVPAGSPDFIVSLSTASLQDEHFMVWLFDYLAGQRAVAPRVIFEIQEYAVHLAYDEIKQLIDLANPMGYRFSIDHFGSGTTTFAYLQSLDIHFIKVDRSFITGIATNTDNQFFIQSVVQIANTRDMLLIAEGVEEEADLAALERLGVDAAMGYLLGRPGPEVRLS